MTPAEAFAALELPLDATPAQIREAYLERARQIHPDAGGDPNQFAALGAVRTIALDYALQPRDCPTCKGEGRVEAKRQGFYVLHKVCPTCHGRKKV